MNRRYFISCLMLVGTATMFSDIALAAASAIDTGVISGVALGGYCAFAVSKGSTAKGDPKVFTIVNGKNFINLSSSVQALWKKDIPGNITAADANWPSLHN
jgi:hypothetical protein